MATVIQDAQRLKKGLVVAGCVPQGDKKATELTVSCCCPGVQILPPCDSQRQDRPQPYQILHLLEAMLLLKTLESTPQWQAGWQSGYSTCQCHGCHVLHLLLHTHIPTHQAVKQ
jgi:hypothetical protein